MYAASTTAVTAVHDHLTRRITRSPRRAVRVDMAVAEPITPEAAPVPAVPAVATATAAPSDDVVAAA